MKRVKILINYMVICFSFVLFHQSIAASVKDISAIDKANQKAILYYVNEYRRAHHLNPLQLNPLMSREAEKHSRDMARHAIPFGHKYFDKRIKRLYAEIKNCRAGSENVAYNYKDGRDVVRNWLTSPGHRRNIEGNYNLTGIGLARDSRGKLYFTQIFIRN